MLPGLTYTLVILCQGMWMLLEQEFAFLDAGMKDHSAEQMYRPVADIRDVAGINAHFDEAIAPIWITLMTMHHYFNWYFTTCAGVLFLMVFRACQHLAFQPKLGVLWKTFTEASEELGHLGGVLLCISFLYALVGNTLFGVQLEGYMTIEAAARNTFLSIFGLFRWRARDRRQEH